MPLYYQLITHIRLIHRNSVIHEECFHLAYIERMNVKLAVDPEWLLSSFYRWNLTVGKYVQRCNLNLKLTRVTHSDDTREETDRQGRDFPLRMSLRNLVSKGLLEICPQSFAYAWSNSLCKVRSRWRCLTWRFVAIGVSD